MRLLCCGNRNPIGVKQETLRLQIIWENDERTPHFSIGIADSLEKLEKRIYNIGIWSEEFFCGNQLLLEQVLFEEGKVYYWHVVRIDDGIEKVSDAASFEMGISEFQGQYITAPRKSTYVKHFFKTFPIVENIRRARLYICGLGYFKWSINGRTIDDTYYRPLVTDYTTRENPDNTTLCSSTSHHVTYYTYDIRDLLLEGENRLEVDVANGYYCNTDRLMCEMDYSFGPAQLAFEIHLETDKGLQVIYSDTDTLVREENYSSTLYVGDRVDFTRDPGVYEKSVLGKRPDGIPVSPVCEDDTVQQSISPIDTWKYDGKIVYDFGVNHTGGLKLQLQAAEGDVLHIRYAEVLEDDGTPNYETGAWHDMHPKTGEAGDIYQENIYILKAGCNVIEPLFSWFCYRYAVLDMPETTSVESVNSLFIHMDVMCDGEFTCSEPLLTKINDTFRQTLCCNMHSGLITDCPHREKRPYTGDGHLVMKAAWYNYDMESFYYKWFQDLLDAQNPDGRIPNTAPDLAGGGGYGWGNAICFVTKQLYQFTGDTNVLTKGYPAITKWLAFYAAHCDADSIVRSNGHNWMLGDWLAPEIVTSNTYYINTVCYLVAVDTALWIADRKFPEDTAYWLQKKSEITDGINKVFFNKEQLTYGNGIQGENILALATDIVPMEYVEAIRKKEEQHYREETNYHLDTGIVITPILIHYLTEHGYADIAYQIMTQTTYPSYGWLMEDDTTFSEHWSKKWPDFYYGDENSTLVKGGGDLSHCHPMYGSICDWLYESVGGLRLTNLYKKEIVISPMYTDMTMKASAGKETSYGCAKVKWENQDDILRLIVEIPQGLQGIVEFPSQYNIMQNLNTKESYLRDSDGRFRFVLPAGKWLLQTKGR